MKKTLFVAALALTAAGHAEAAPVRTLGIPQGNLTCTIAGSPTTKLFVQIQRSTARVALRSYPYYGETHYKTLRLRVVRGASATFGGRYREVVMIRALGNGAFVGSGRIEGKILSLTCTRS